MTEIHFLYTLRHPICGIIKYTNDPNEAEQHSRSGWDVYCKGVGIRNGKVYKHSN